MKRTMGVLAVVVVAVVAMVVAAADPTDRRSGAPLDPRSTIDSGARAAVLLVEETGIEVSVGDVPLPGRTGTVVVLRDDLDDVVWEELERFVDAGGDVVTAARSGPLQGRARSTVDGSVDFDGPCEIPELAAVRKIDAPVVRTYSAEVGCLRGADDASGAVAAERSVGSGRVLTIGTAHPWRNDALAEADHAALVVGTAEWGTSPVTFLRGPELGGGTEELRSLVPIWIWALLGQLAVAVFFYGLWRAIRFGPVVREDEHVVFDANELVRATGRLTEHTADDAWAADQLLRRWRAELGIAGPTSPDVSEKLADALALDAEDAGHLRASLDPAPVAPLDRAASIERARRALRTRTARAAQVANQEDFHGPTS